MRGQVAPTAATLAHQLPSPVRLQLSLTSWSRHCQVRADVNSADEYYSVREPAVARYNEEDIQHFSRSDPLDIYPFLEKEVYLHAIRVPVH